LHHTELYGDSVINKVDPLISMSLLLIIILHLMSHLTTRSCTMALKFHRVLLQSAFARIYPQGIPRAISQVLSHFPLTVNSLMQWFPLSSTFTIYAICPTCSCLYPPNHGVYPVMCTYDEFGPQKQQWQEKLANSKKEPAQPSHSDKGRQKWCIKNGFSDPTKAQEGRDRPRKDVMNRH